MSNQVRHRILILRKSQWGESNVIIHGLSSQGQRCTFLARGALKSKKRFAGGILDPLQYVEVLATKSPKQDSLMSLDEAQLIDGFDGLRTDFDNLEAAFWATDVIQRVTFEDDPHNKTLFDLLGNGLRALAHGVNGNKFRIQFGLKMLMNQGVLQSEPWMNSYLSKSLEEGSTIEDDDSQQRLPWIEQQIKIYVKSGEGLG